MADLDAIRQRADAATKGPWHAEESGGFYEIYTKGSGESPLLPYEPPMLLSSSESDEEIRREDAEFIVHAREDVPALLAEVETARGVLAMWELVASREEVTAVQRLAVVRALCHNLTKRANPANCYLPVSDILRALNGESTKDGA